MPKAKRVTIQCARCRRVGEKLFLKGEKCFSIKCPLIKRNYPPGAHGGKKGHLTSYGEQLKEKQKAKRSYGLREKQFRNYVTRAFQKKGDTAATLLQSLETRLDNVIYRLGLAKSREMARQLVNHAHFLVNDKKVNIPSFAVRVNDLITLREKSGKMKLFENCREMLLKHESPPWLSFNLENLSGKIVSLPNVEEMQPNFDVKKIIEFYSR